MARPRPGDRFDVTATDLDFEGRGVARAGEIEVHVADLVPGERADVVLQGVSRHAARGFASVERRIGAPSDARGEVACPGAPCGGCSWQHLRYPAQLEHKRRRVERALAAAMAQPPPVAPVVPSREQTGYRNKGIFVLAARRGGVALGAYAPRSHDWIDTSGCRILTAAIQAALPRVAAALSASGLQVYDERARTGQVRYAILRSSRAGEVLVGLAATSDAPREALSRIADRLLAGPVRGVVWVANDTTSGSVLGEPPVLLAGAATIAESIAGVPVEVAIDTFLQVHLDQAERLYARLVEVAVAGGAVHRAVDLYCGIGAIAHALAMRGIDVVGVERNVASVQAATAAAARAGLAARARFQAIGADDAGPLLATARPDLVVVNPPRQGLGDRVRADLVAAAPGTIAYVSCGPESLARDLAALVAAGYRLEPVEPFDFMPGTGHVEALAVLRR